MRPRATARAIASPRLGGRGADDQAAQQLVARRPGSRPRPSYGDACFELDRRRGSRGCPCPKNAPPVCGDGEVDHDLAVDPQRSGPTAVSAELPVAGVGPATNVPRDASPRTARPRCRATAARPVHMKCSRSVVVGRSGRRRRGVLDRRSAPRERRAALVDRAALLERDVEATVAQARRADRAPARARAPRRCRRPGSGRARRSARSTRSGVRRPPAAAAPRSFFSSTVRRDRGAADDVAGLGRRSRSPRWSSLPPAPTHSNEREEPHDRLVDVAPRSTSPASHRGERAASPRCDGGPGISRSRPASSDAAGAVRAEPVADHDAVEAPLVAQHAAQQRPVLAAVGAVDAGCSCSSSSARRRHPSTGATAASNGTRYSSRSVRSSTSLRDRHPLELGVVGDEVLDARRDAAVPARRATYADGDAAR